jgi:hypothetical protein
MVFPDSRKIRPGPRSSFGNAHAMPPFQLEIENQGWLEILAKVDKGQLLA